MALASPVSIRPFLMFEGKAEEAIKFYTSVFANSEIKELERWAAGRPGEGTIMKATFRIGDLEILCSDSAVKHGFTFTPSVSLFVTFAKEDELLAALTALLQDGQTLMPVGNYGFSTKFAWVNDRYGVSWQLNLP